MPAFVEPTLLGDDLNPAGLVEVLLTVSLTGTMLLRPLYEADGETIRDFAWVRLNPAAQRLLRLPEHPAESFLTLFPAAPQVGVFQFYRDAFNSGRLERRQNLYQHDGLDGYYILVAQRHAQLVVVNFTDGNDQSRTAVEEALRESQAREQQARAEAERQRADLTQAFEQAPVAFALFQGPALVVEFANPAMGLLLGCPAAELRGRPVFEAAPALRGQRLETLLNSTFAQGTPFDLLEVPLRVGRAPEGQPEQRYFNLTGRPRHGVAGTVTGVACVGVEVTTQVVARQQVEEKERQTNFLNEELQAANKEILANNSELARAQQQQRQLNEDLEGRVHRRTHQLQEQQGLLRQILTQLPAAVATLSGPEHRFAFANAGYQQLVADRATLGKSVAEALPEVAEQGIIGLLDRVYTTGERFVGREIALMLLRADAPPAQQYFDFTYQPLTDGPGRVQGILVFAVDVTEQLRVRRQSETLQAAMLAVAQRRAQERQELYQIFEQTPTAIVLLREPDHRIDYFNPAFEELFPPAPGVRLRQGRPLGEVYPHLREAGLLPLLDRVFRSGEPQVVLEMPLANWQPGSSRYVTLAYQAYREQDRTVGVAAFVYDATEQVLTRQQVQNLNQELAAINQAMQATNAELRQSNARLTRTNADLDTFVYSASHDLKSPITNIEGLLLALRQQLPPAAWQTELVPKLLSLMDGAVTRFQQTLGHLTDVSRLQQLLLDQPTEAVDLPALVENVRLDILPELTAADATLTVHLRDCSTVYFPAKNLRSILYNLLSNAIKYRAPDRPARVLLRGQPNAAGQLVLEVQDNGLGLTPPQQSELFQLFRRLHTHVSGSGVGLYMVKKIVDNAGGTLTVQSQPGVGSTFTVTLPAAELPKA